MPMLPEPATERLALGRTDVSPALSFGLDLGPDGAVEDVKIEPSSVRVTRLSYREAESQLYREPLRTLHEWAQRFRAKRQAAGAVEINLPEVKVRVEHDTVVIRPLPELKSRALVQEAMLMAGEAIARFALAAGFPFPYTTQDLADAPSALPDGLAGMYALRRTMRPGQVKSVPGSHAGLGLAYYARVTSPLRRYLDLVAHQQLRAYLRGSNGLEEQELLSRVGAAEAVSSSVRQAERLANKHWTLVYLLQNPDWRGEGVVVEKLDRRSTILIPELDLEVRTYVRDDLPLNSVVSLTLPQVNLVELGAHFHVERGS